jgi:hypothetical protein
LHTVGIMAGQLSVLLFMAQSLWSSVQRRTVG